MSLGPPQQYIVTYNGQQLPGYAQSEDDPTEATLVDNYAYGWDGSLTEYAGLTNKALQMKFRIWDVDYRTVKNQYHLATTILRSRRKGTANLFVDYTDRYFSASVKTVSYSQDVSMNRKILDYSVEFDCLPWMTSTSGYILTGTGNIDTDQKGRTFSDGGWTPTTIIVSGTNVTISGYTPTEFTGFISISGAVTNFTIDSTNFTSTTASGATGDGLMYWSDYQMWVGPGKTSFATTGVSAITVKYNNRWY